MLRDKRLVITGASDAETIAYAVTERALLAGAFVTLVAAPHEVDRCRALAGGLPFGAHVVRADLNDPADVARLREHLRCGYRGVDGALHAGGGAPPEALADALAPLLPPGGRSLVALGDDGETACFALGEDARAITGEVLLLGGPRAAAPALAGGR